MIQIDYAPMDGGRLGKVVLYTDHIMRASFVMPIGYVRILIEILKSYETEFEIKETTLEKLYEA